MPCRLGQRSSLGILFISVALFGCGGGNNNNNNGGGPGGGNPISDNPAPTLSTISPSSATAGSSGTTVTLTGSNFISTSIAQWNGTSLSTSFTNSTTLTAQIPSSDLVAAGDGTVTVNNPTPGGGTSAGLQFAIAQALAPGETVVNVAANDLAWDPVNKVIYLSLPSADGANGNTIQILNPTTGTLGASAFAGSEPNLLAVSSSSKYLYVSLNGASDVQRLTLPSLGIDIKIALGADSFDGPFYAMDLQAAPNSDGTVAVVRETPGYSPAEEGGVVIYDDGTQRPNVLCGWIQTGCPNVGTGLYDSIQWSSDATEMFAANNEDTAFDFYTIPVTSAGFGTPTAYGGLVPGFGYDIHYDATTGYVYDDDGSIIDPVAGSVVGTFSASGIMVPDGTLGKAFFIGQSTSNFGSTTYTLESFDINKFTPIATLNIPNVEGTPTHLIRWGTNGIAFTTANSFGSSSAPQVYLISGSFVDGNSSTSKTKPVENVRRTWKVMTRPVRGSSLWHSSPR